MPMKKDDSGRRRVEMEFLVPGPPEQVWQAIFFYGSVGDRSGRRRTTEMERVAAWPPRR